MIEGKSRRLSRIFATDGKTLIVPVDDSLIFGPFDGLDNINQKLENILLGKPNAILGYHGLFTNNENLNSVGRIINITASTINSCHTKKCIISTVEHLIRCDADSIACHMNITSRYESHMLANLGILVSEAERYSIPITAIVYPRKELENGLDENFQLMKTSNIKEYTKLLCHGVRIAKELGASIIKTHYPGDSEMFEKVIEAAYPIPVVISGGEFKDSKKILKEAEDAIICGGKGVCFGRNVFSRKDSNLLVAALFSIIHENYSSDEAYLKFLPNNKKED